MSSCLGGCSSVQLSWLLYYFSVFKPLINTKAVRQQDLACVRCLTLANPCKNKMSKVQGCRGSRVVGSWYNIPPEKCNNTPNTLHFNNWCKMEPKCCRARWLERICNLDAALLYLNENDLTSVFRMDHGISLYCLKHITSWEYPNCKCTLSILIYNTFHSFWSIYI